MKHKLLAIVMVGVLAAPMTVNATPVTFTYTDTFSSSSIPGVALGDTWTLSVIVDNGGSSLFSQSWSASDLISGLFTSDSYFQSFNAGMCGGFSTNAIGAVVSAICGSLGDNVDSFGSSGYLNNNAVQDSNERFAFFTNESMGERPAAWTASFSAVPEPGSLALVGLALAGVAFGRRRKDA